MINKEKDGRLEVNIDRFENILRYTISDNGGGMKKSINKNESNGISITRQRIKNLNKIHKTHAYCNMEELFAAKNLPRGVKVELGLPLVMEEI